MASRALREWRTTQRAELDRLDGQLRQVRGGAPEQRAVRLQLVDAGIVLLAGHFQRYCRDLYGEAASFLAAQVQSGSASAVVHDVFLVNTALARGNARPQALQADFNRFGFDVWIALKQHDGRDEGRRDRLAELVTWRNAVAHQNLQTGQPAPSHTGVGRNLRTLRMWRHVCSALAHDLDAVVKHRLTTLAGRRPW
jgi:hypothetical protein